MAGSPFMGAMSKSYPPVVSKKVPSGIQAAAKNRMASKAPAKKGALPPWLTKK